MIYEQLSPDAAIDQGDLIDRCPALRLQAMPAENDGQQFVAVHWRRIVVLTQTCDLANEKTQEANIAEVFDAQY